MKTPSEPDSADLSDWRLYNGGLPRRTTGRPHGVTSRASNVRPSLDHQWLEVCASRGAGEPAVFDGKQFVFALDKQLTADLVEATRPGIDVLALSASDMAGAAVSKARTPLSTSRTSSAVASMKPPPSAS